MLLSNMERSVKFQNSGGETELVKLKRKMNNFEMEKQHVCGVMWTVDVHMKTDQVDRICPLVSPITRV